MEAAEPLGDAAVDMVVIKRGRRPARPADDPQFAHRLHPLPAPAWISEREPFGTGTHVAFTCADRATVDAFHEAALAAGGIDNGAPGLREQYHPTYYGAFVHDLDGNNVEAVCHAA